MLPVVRIPDVQPAGQSDLPVYQQIAAQLREQIENGEVAEGMRELEKALASTQEALLRAAASQESGNGSQGPGSDAERVFIAHERFSQLVAT